MKSPGQPGGAAGVTSPVEAIECLIHAAKGFGARVVSNCAANELLVEGGQVVGVITQAGNIHGSKTVLTAGLGTLDLLSRQGMHLPILSSPAIIINFDVSDDLLNGIVSSSEMEARQAGARALIAAEDYIDDTEENGPAAIGFRALTAIRAELKGAESIELRSVAVGWRPIPDDRLPIVGPMSATRKVCSGRKPSRPVPSDTGLYHGQPRLNCVIACSRKRPFWILLDPVMPMLSNSSMMHR
ncbi:NAD(P)/FAD-dependent oxidoreductase [Pseudomonas fluorescens]|uniref:NAD(P)/FAD-dependent oxidoreductase n=1 Tax=Pseudomonas fluorescens TaxID=294 RepID=UPI001CD24EE7|nr:FAD-dependent oxidoreductase [Pseudomonas fluorescens]